MAKPIVDSTTPLTLDVVGEPFKTSTGLIYLPVKAKGRDAVPFLMEFDPSDDYTARGPIRPPRKHKLETRLKMSTSQKQRWNRLNEEFIAPVRGVKNA